MQTVAIHAAHNASLTIIQPSSHFSTLCRVEEIHHIQFALLTANKEIFLRTPRDINNFKATFDLINT
jgi:hypothetical protein